MTDDDKDGNVKRELKPVKQDSQMVHQKSGTFKHFTVDCNHDQVSERKLTISSL